MPTPHHNADQACRCCGTRPIGPLSQSHHEVLAQLHIQQTWQQLPAVQRRVLAMRAVAVKHTKQVAASDAAKVPNLDEELILVLTLERAKAYVLETSSLSTSRKQTSGQQKGYA